MTHASWNVQASALTLRVDMGPTKVGQDIEHKKHIHLKMLKNELRYELLSHLFGELLSTSFTHLRFPTRHIPAHIIARKHVCA